MTARVTARAVAMVVALISAFALTGCSVTDLWDLELRIEEAGYRDVLVSESTSSDRTTLTVEARTLAPRDFDREDIETIAGIVWDTYPHDFDQLRITLNGAKAESLSRDELTLAFGPRPEQLVQPEGNGRLIVLIVTLSIFVLLMSAIAVVLTLVLRRQKRQAQQQPPPYPAYPPYPGYWPPPR